MSLGGKTTKFQPASTTTYSPNMKEYFGKEHVENTKKYEEIGTWEIQYEGVCGKYENI